MSDLRLRARSVTEIVDAAFQLYRRDALEYVLVAAIAYAPLILVQIVLVGGLVLSSARMLTGPIGATYLLGIIGIFAYALMSAVLSRFSSDVYLDRPTGLGVVVRAVLPLVPRLIGATIVFALVLMLGFIPVIIGTAMSNFSLIFIGMLLSIVWACYAMARFFAVFQTIVLEDRGIVAAFSRSSVLSQNRKGHILLTLLLVIIIFFMLAFAVNIVGSLFGSVAGLLVMQALYSVVAYPLIGITQMILYYDTRIRAEGFDIEVMTGALGSPTTAAS
ncbi:MAG TPA: hypothetical protein VJW73_08095 [Gemmatimonadaceae bacterium]|nr:hypothetical protein [Gemmatimonadaceae bacterium]